MKVWKLLRKTSFIELILVKLQSAVSTLLSKDFTTDYFWNMYLQLAVLKEYFEKKSMVNQCFNKLQSSNTWPTISSTNGANVGFLCRSLENFNVFTGRPP